MIKDKQPEEVKDKDELIMELRKQNEELKISMDRLSINTEREIARLTNRIKDLEANNNPDAVEALEKQLHTLQRDYASMLEDKEGIEKGILRLIKKLGEESNTQNPG